MHETEQLSYDEQIYYLDKDIDMIELDRSLNKLKKNKASGVDNIINEFLIFSTVRAKEVMLAIFNSILLTQHFPSIWVKGEIAPIFKKGCKFDANNYRGIVIISCLGKLFTTILNNRLNTWAESEGLLTESQFGFRRGRGTTDGLFVLHGLIEILLARNKRLYCVFVDYEKAYDYLNRAAVFSKLLNFGISSKCINLFKSMYADIELMVK